MIDICAIGILRVTAALVNAGLLRSGSKVLILSMTTSMVDSSSYLEIQPVLFDRCMMCRSLVSLLKEEALLGAPHKTLKVLLCHICHY
jgi:hypothetical protein